MVEQTPEISSETASYEASRNKAEILARALKGAQQIGIAIGKAASDIIHMIFK